VSTTAWLVLAAIFVTGAFLVSEGTPSRRTVDQASTWLLRRLAAARTRWLTDLANGINVAGLYWYPLIGVVVVLLIMIFRRWRHLLVLMFSLFFLETIGGWIYNALSRPRLGMRRRCPHHQRHHHSRGPVSSSSALSARQEVREAARRYLAGCSGAF
jgi:hypothetical protein